MTTVPERIRAMLAGDYERGLDALLVRPAAEVNPALMTALWDACGRQWRRGWQPTELHRVALWRGEARPAALVTDAVAAHLRSFPSATVDDRWWAQAETLGATVWWRDDATYPDELAVRWRVDRTVVLDAIVTLLGVLATLPPLAVLIPPPGTAPRPARPAGPDGPLLHRVRALLAKAESTPHPAEAEAYSAKAQELVTRHRLDEALLAPREATDVTPYARRIGLDRPYDGEKAALLDAVASANRCQVVWSAEFGVATVFGFDADLDAVELLYTSLLVQGHRALSQAEPPGGKAGRARLKAFRRSFLVAFAVRIGERLAQAADAALAGLAADADDGAARAAVVLASRDEEVRAALRSAFPRTERGRGVPIDSAEGWESGQAAADHAVLAVRRAD